MWLSQSSASTIVRVYRCRQPPTTSPTNGARPQQRRPRAMRSSKVHPANSSTEGGGEAASYEAVSSSMNSLCGCFFEEIICGLLDTSTSSVVVIQTGLRWMVEYCNPVSGRRHRRKLGCLKVKVSLRTCRRFSSSCEVGWADGLAGRATNLTEEEAYWHSDESPCRARRSSSPHRSRDQEVRERDRDAAERGTRRYVPRSGVGTTKTQ